MGRDYYSSNCNRCDGRQQAVSGAAGGAPQEPLPAAGIDEAGVELLLQLDEAAADAVEAVLGLAGRERVVDFVEFLESVERPVALRLGQQLVVRDCFEKVGDGGV